MLLPCGVGWKSWDAAGMRLSWCHVLCGLFWQCCSHRCIITRSISITLITIIGISSNCSTKAGVIVITNGAILNGKLTHDSRAAVRFGCIITTISRTPSKVKGVPNRLVLIVGDACMKPTALSTIYFILFICTCNLKSKHIRKIWSSARRALWGSQSLPATSWANAWNNAWCPTRLSGPWPHPRQAPWGLANG